MQALIAKASALARQASETCGACLQAPVFDVAARKEYTGLRLQALSLLLQAGVPSQRQELRTWEVQTVFPAGEQELEKLRQEEERHLADWQRVRLLNELVALRRVLTRNIVGSYSNKPYATDELKELATEILKNDEVVQQLVAAVQQNTGEAPPPPPPLPSAPSVREALNNARDLYLRANSTGALALTAPGADWTAARKQMADLELQALAAILAAGAPAERLPLPRIDPLGPADTRSNEAFSAYLTKNKEQVGAWQEALVLDELFSWRELLTLSLCSLYGNKPYATEELRRLATGTLKNDAAVQDLLARVKAATGE